MLTFSLTLLPKIVYFLFLAAILALYLKKKSLPSVLIRLGTTVAVVFFVYLGFSKTFFTYIAWSQDGFSKHFLPPYAPISYFVNYSFFRFWLGYLIAGAMALLIFGFLIFLKKKRPVLLDKEDASLAAFGALVSGWPGLIVYFPLALLLMFFWHIFLSLRSTFPEFRPPKYYSAVFGGRNSQHSDPSVIARSVSDEAISQSQSNVNAQHSDPSVIARSVSDEAISQSQSNVNSQLPNVFSERVPITAFIFIAAFATLFFSSYILKYLGLEVLIVAKSAY